MSAPAAPRRRAGVLAIDLGTEKHGFASTDALRIARQPLAPLRARWPSPAFDAHLRRLLAERDIEVLLIGLPIHMDGREGGQSARSRQLAIALKASYPGLDVRLYDERLTTKAAQERLLDLGLSEPERRRLRDSFAALVLLEDWILSGEPPGAP